MLEQLKQKPTLSFCYDGVPFAQAVLSEEKRAQGDTQTTVYVLPHGLTVTTTLRFLPGFDAVEIVNHFENTGSEPSGILSELWDCAVRLPMEQEEPYRYSAYLPDTETATKICSPKGSTWSYDEFACNLDAHWENRYQHHLYVGETRRFANSGGRSSDGTAPFFRVQKNRGGYLYAVGWTGQWNFEAQREEDFVGLRSRLEDTHFRVLPGEKFRTSSAVILRYEGDAADAQNQWRRLVRTHFSLIGSEGRDPYGPLCASIWGGMDTAEGIRRVGVLRDNQIPVEYIWMDAGWYGADTRPTPDEFEGDWGSHTGDWVVSPLVHPDGLRDFSKAVHDAGMKLILWFEPERVIPGTPTAREHPEYFLGDGSENPWSILLNLGDERAWSYIYETLSGLIADIGIDCYRQDFNFAPLGYWRHNDAEDRRGITEILHINGLYRLWDALLARFPHLLIDNCASGGRRIDIETLRRSIPLWRSDLECPANYPITGVQSHHLSFGSWMPFSGTGSGRDYDTYRIRSAYAPALTTNYAYSQRNDFGGDAGQLAWLKARAEEYLRLRPYFSEDCYPLTEISDAEDVWSAVQFNRPSGQDGIVQVFRREKAPYTECCFRLRGLEPERTYILIELDCPEQTRTLSGKELLESGLTVRMEEARSAKIWLYHAQ